MQGNTITNVSSPALPSDATNKHYVDNQMETLISKLNTFQKEQDKTRNQLKPT